MLQELLSEHTRPVYSPEQVREADSLPEVRGGVQGGVGRASWATRAEPEEHVEPTSRRGTERVPGRKKKGSTHTPSSLCQT